jgi:hypothetical protein
MDSEIEKIELMTDESRCQILKSEEHDASKLFSAVITEAPRWLFVVVGVAYATGFLVVSAYLRTFGITDTTGEFLRLRYFAIGFYFLVFLGSVMTMCVSLVGAHRLAQEGEDKATQTKAADNYPTSFINALFRYLLFLVFIALMVGFAPFQQSTWPRLLLAASVCLTLLGTVWLNLLVKLYKIGVGKAVSRSIKALCNSMKEHPAAWVLGVALLALDTIIVIIFKVPYRDLWRVETALFVIWVSMLGYVIYHTFFRRPGLPVNAHKMFMGVRVALSLALYYLCVLSFAHGIYPLMSGEKGGGYFADAGRVVIVLRGDVRPLPEALMEKVPTPVVPAAQPLAVSTKEKAARKKGRTSPDRVQNAATEQLPTRSNRSYELVLIEQEPTALYVADPNEKGGAECWIKAGIRPIVYEVQMSDVAGLEHHAPVEPQSGTRCDPALAAQTIRAGNP